MACYAQTPQKITYTYDALNRLTQVMYPNGEKITYNYDVLGNRTSVVQTGCTATPTAVISGGGTINSGQSTTLTITFTGISPYNYTLSSGYSGISYSASQTLVTSPAATTTYTLTSVSNQCGAGTFSGSAVVTVIPACQQSDLIISDIIVTKYGSNKIDYRVVVKNIGNQTVSLGNFSFSTYGSSNGTNKDVLKHVMFLGGGNLAKNQTINYDVSAGMDYRSNQHYFILLADHYGMIAECNENNNEGSKLVKPCSDNGNATLTGSRPSGLLATNGNFNMVNFTPSANTVITARSITGFPTVRANSPNITMQIGSCLSSPANTSVSQNAATKSQKDLLSFDESQSTNGVNFRVEQSSNLTISIWDQETQSKLKDIATNKTFTEGNQVLDLSKENLTKGKTYIVHFETVEGHFAKVVEW